MRGFSSLPPSLPPLMRINRGESVGGNEDEGNVSEE